MAHGRFAGLFLQGVARQAIATGAAMAGSLGIGRPLGNGHRNATCAHAMAIQCDAGMR